jgi:hypothetical protein
LTELWHWNGLMLYSSKASIKHMSELLFFCYKWIVVFLLQVNCCFSVTSELLFFCYKWVVVFLLQVSYFCFSVTSELLFFCYKWVVVFLLQVSCCFSVTSELLFFCYKWIVVFLLQVSYFWYLKSNSSYTVYGIDFKILFVIKRRIKRNFFWLSDVQWYFLLWRRCHCQSKTIVAVILRKGSSLKLLSLWEWEGRPFQFESERL